MKVYVILLISLSTFMISSPVVAKPKWMMFDISLYDHSFKKNDAMKTLSEVSVRGVSELFNSYEDCEAELFNSKAHWQLNGFRMTESSGGKLIFINKDWLNGPAKVGCFILHP